MDKIIPKNPIKFGIFITMLHKKWALIAVLCVFVATGLDRGSVLVIKQLTDNLTMNVKDLSAIWFWATAYPFVFLAAHICWRASGFMGMRWFTNMRTSAYQTLYDYLSYHSKDFFNNRFAGTLTNKIGHAVVGAETLFEKALWNFFPLLLGLVWYIVITWIEDYRLGLIITLWSIFFLSINIYFAKHLQPRSFRSAESLSILKGRMVDSLSNISLVHEYANISGEQNYINRFIKKHKDASLAHWTFSEIILTINGIFIFIFIISMVLTAIYLLENNLISIGSVLMIATIVTHLYSQFLFIGQELRDAAAYYGEAKEGLIEILHDHVITDSPTAKEVKITKGTISIDTIDFQYDNRKIFEDFTLTIPSGQKVGLVGRSGAGKTTFVSLLLRHYDIQKGSISLDNHSINDITLDSLRSAIAFVPQDTSLFHRTIKENIKYGSPNATDSEIEKAAKLSQAEEFINSLPKGYDTLVGERGVRLSGGQRQRIAIARAFLKDAPIVILDEATSSLDSHSEHAIQTSIESLMVNRTVIAIAHRLSTLKKMDRIIVIENGKIQEDGSPDELLKKPKGIFKSLWDHQVNGFIVDE